MGFVRIFWKNKVQETYLPKISIPGEIFFEILAQLCSDNSTQTLLNSVVHERRMVLKIIVFEKSKANETDSSETSFY